MSVRVMSLVFGSDLPPTDRLVALALADHAHDDGTRVWPSIPNLAAKVGLGTTATRSAVRRLEAGGVLEPVRSDPGKVREYRFVPRWLIAQLTPTQSVGVDDDTPTGDGTDPNAAPSGPQRIGVAEPPTTEPPTTEPSKTPRAREPASITVLPIPSAFDAFWTSYPRRTGKGAARKAWDTALDKAPATALIAAAVRFRDDPNRDPAYTPHPATWLNQERWEDDPLPPRNGTPRDPALEGMRAAAGMAGLEATDDQLYASMEAALRGEGGTSNGSGAGRSGAEHGAGVLPDAGDQAGHRPGLAGGDHAAEA